MGNSIRVSEKHGVNPSLIKCFFCGEAKAVALLGMMKGDKQAPRDMIVDYEPCDTCAAEFAKGILFIECAETPNTEDQFPIQEGAYPTGRWAVFSEDILNNFKDIPEGQKVFLMDPQMANQMGVFDE